LQLPTTTIFFGSIKFIFGFCTNLLNIDPKKSQL
jgi:hypothetical protein